MISYSRLFQPTVLFTLSLVLVGCSPGYRSDQQIVEQIFGSGARVRYEHTGLSLPCPRHLGQVTLRCQQVSAQLAERLTFGKDRTG